MRDSFSMLMRDEVAAAAENDDDEYMTKSISMARRSVGVCERM